MPTVKKVKLSEIETDKGNANRHTERGTKLVANSIQEHGFIDAGTLDKDNRIANGNSRTEIASGQGADEAYVVEFEARDGTPVYLKYNDLDLETDEGRRAAYALNRTAQLSIDWDPEQVAADLQAGLKLDDMFQDFEVEEILDGLDVPGFGNEGEDTEPQIDRADELRQEWGTETGQLWQLGEHRLICGNCTDKAVVERVGISADMCLFADPPYGISYDPSWLDGVYQHRQALSSRNTLENDDGSLDLSFLWNHSKRFVWGFPYIFDKDATGWIVWDKQPGVEKRGIVTPIEMASTTLRKGFDMVRVMWGGYYRAADEDSQPHPTQKPKGVIEPFLSIWTTEGDEISDYFLGSGTTLIACENLGRKCRAIEIDAGYVAVALQRYYDHTGDKPVLLDTIKTV